MAATVNHGEDIIRVRQYITDLEGHKIAAVIDLEELNRLEAMLEVIPSDEAWLYRNDEALQSVRRGLRDAAESKVSKLDLDAL